MCLTNNFISDLEDESSSKEENSEDKEEGQTDQNKLLMKLMSYNLMQESN